MARFYRARPAALAALLLICLQQRCLPDITKMQCIRTVFF
jgi:hypothetical protein